LGIYEANIVIKNEKIVALTDKAYIHPAEQYIDAKGKYLFPGWIDVHNHFSYDDFQILARSARLGGLTTILPSSAVGPMKIVSLPAALAVRR
jgi:dihydroorotase-like cyclic amidohydrolase